MQENVLHIQPIDPSLCTLQLLALLSHTFVLETVDLVYLIESEHLLKIWETWARSGCV